MSTVETYDFPTYEGLTGFHLARWIKDHSTLSPSARWVANLLAIHYYNAERGVAFPSTPTLSEDTGLALATIKRAIKELVSSGEWVVVPGNGNRRSITRDYMSEVTTNLYAPVLGDRLPSGVTETGTRTVTVTRTEVERDVESKHEPQVQPKVEQEHLDREAEEPYSVDSDPTAPAWLRECRMPTDEELAAEEAEAPQRPARYPAPVPADRVRDLGFTPREETRRFMEEQPYSNDGTTGALGIDPTLYGKTGDPF